MKGPRPRIVVVGSFVTDLVFRVQRRPGPGETMLADEFGMFLGGKGFNQAIAARRLGADVAMVGRLGTDAFGDMFLARLAAEGIDPLGVRRDGEAGTAIASPVVDADGQNSIIAAPRANMRVTLGDVEAAADSIAAADVLMLQFEIPLAASRRAAEIARAHDTLVLLDPAPVGHGSPDAGVHHQDTKTLLDGVEGKRGGVHHQDTKTLLDGVEGKRGGVHHQDPKTQRWQEESGQPHPNPGTPALSDRGRCGQPADPHHVRLCTRPLDHFPVDYLVPNEIEAHMLTGRMTPEECAAVLLPETRKGVVVSLGERGALAVSRAGSGEFPAHKVKVVDSTGAGDAFRAGLAVKIAGGAGLEDAVRFANACGALACTVFGTGPSMPKLEAVERLLAGGVT
jgi:sugar/nucleoside kinase (ribokinase family)